GVACCRHDRFGNSRTGHQSPRSVAGIRRRFGNASDERGARFRRISRARIRRFGPDRTPARRVPVAEYSRHSAVDLGTRNAYLVGKAPASDNPAAPNIRLVAPLPPALGGDVQMQDNIYWFEPQMMLDGVVPSIL